MLKTKHFIYISLSNNKIFNAEESYCYITQLFPYPLVPTGLLHVYLSLFHRQNLLLSCATYLHYEKACNHYNIPERFYFI